jgi:4-aminobutyrate aminotransferase-like enzyme
MLSFRFNINPVKVDQINTKFRKINTKIPAPGTIKILRNLHKFEARSMHGQIPIVWNKAKNFTITDILGNKWIDFTSSIFMANTGHSNNNINKAIKKTITNSLYSSYTYPNASRSNYLKKLIKFVGKPFEKAFLVSSGTEAVEVGIKLMRMYGKNKSKNKKGIITLEGNWHGRTMGAQMLTSNLSQKEWIGYKDPSIYHLPFPYPWTVKKNFKKFFFDSINKLKKNKNLNFKKDICGIILESFQGWGAIFYPNQYIKELNSFCKKNNIILMFDEMQAGFGRTGKIFGFQHYKIKPDLVACGKGIGGGVPLSAIIGKKFLMDLPDIGSMSSTHSANPLVCAAGEAVINEIQNKNLIKESFRKGLILHERLKELKSINPKIIKDICGKGLVASIIFNKIKNYSSSFLASTIVEKCMQKGLLLVHTGRESIKIGPPLTISDSALIEGIDVIILVFKEEIKKVI